MVIEHKHSLGASEARRRVGELEPSLREKYGLELEWRTNQAIFRGKGFSGTLVVNEDRVSIELKLGLLARPFAGRIESAMREQMAKALG